jgi:hypothetical protein
MSEASLAEALTSDLAQRAWRDVAAWTNAQAKRHYRELCGRQPALLAFATEVLEDEADPVFTLAIDLLLTLERTYQLATGHPSAPIDADVVLAAATASQERFLAESGTPPEAFMQALFDSGELAAPELVETLIAILSAVVDTNPEIAAEDVAALLPFVFSAARIFEIGQGIAPPAAHASGGAAIAPAAGAPKVGRNAACPCGSGKKFKRCCGQQRPAAPSEPLSPVQKRFMDYIVCAEEVMEFAQNERSPDGIWHAKQMAAFEEQFAVGDDGVVPDSVHVNHVLFDLALPSARVPMGVLYGRRRGRQIDAKSRRVLRELCDSYLAFYELTGDADGKPSFRELVTGAAWRGCDVDAPETFDFEPGEVWLCRFVGPQDDAIAFGQPLIYPPEALMEVEQALAAILEEIRAADPENRGAPFSSSMKQAGEYLASYITLTAPEEDSEDDGEEEEDLCEEEDLDPEEDDDGPDTRDEDDASDEEEDR